MKRVARASSRPPLFISIKQSSEFSNLFRGARRFSQLNRCGRSCETSIDENLHINPAILRASFGCRVISHRLCFAVTERCDDSAQRDEVGLSQITDDRISALLAQPSVVIGGTIGRSVAQNFDDIGLL